MSDTQANVETVRRYLRAIEAGAADGWRDQVFDPEVVQVEFPNRLKPEGDRRDLAAMSADGRKGAKILQSQSYEITNVIAAEDRVAIEVRWRGVMAIPYGALAVGDVMTVRSAMVFAFREGRIVSQHNYDCVEPF